MSIASAKERMRQATPMAKRQFATFYSGGLRGSSLGRWPPAGCCGSDAGYGRDSVTRSPANLIGPFHSRKTCERPVSSMSHFRILRAAPFTMLVTALLILLHSVTWLTGGDEAVGRLFAAGGFV